MVPLEGDGRVGEVSVAVSIGDDANVDLEGIDIRSPE